MKKLTAEDLRNLKYGDKVYRMSNNDVRRLDFVGLMPRANNYLIFSDGEYLTHLYVSPTDNTFKDDWYGGEYDSEFIGNLKIAYLEERINGIKKIYLNN